MLSESPNEWQSAELDDVTLVTSESSPESVEHVEAAQQPKISLVSEDDLGGKSVETSPEPAFSTVPETTGSTVPKTAALDSLHQLESWHESDQAGSNALPLNTPESSKKAPRRIFSSGTVHTLRQAYNVFYFLLAGASIIFLSDFWNLPLLKVVGWSFFAFCITALILILKKRTAPSEWTSGISLRVSKQIRYCAIFAPIPLIAAATMLMPFDFEFKRGVELNQQRNYGEAILHLMLANALGPPSGKALDALSLSYNRTGDRTGALSAAEAALRLNRSDSEAMAQKAWALDAMKRPEEAIATAQAALALDPNNGIAAAALAYGYYHSGQYELAKDAATYHIKLHGDEFTAYELRANVNEKLGLLTEAQEDREQMAKLEAAFEATLKASADTHTTNTN